MERFANRHASADDSKRRIYPVTTSRLQFVHHEYILQQVGENDVINLSIKQCLAFMVADMIGRKWGCFCGLMWRHTRQRWRRFRCDEIVARPTLVCSAERYKVRDNNAQKSVPPSTDVKRDTQEIAAPFTKTKVTNCKLTNYFVSWYSRERRIGNFDQNTLTIHHHRVELQAIWRSCDRVKVSTHNTKTHNTSVIFLFHTCFHLHNREKESPFKKAIRGWTSNERQQLDYVRAPAREESRQEVLTKSFDRDVMRNGRSFVALMFVFGKTIVACHEKRKPENKTRH